MVPPSRKYRRVVSLVAALPSVSTAQPKANPFKPMELACVDTEGKAATKDTTLRYYRDGGTIVGYDEQGMFYVYTPPRGWVCRFGEVKK